MLVGVSRLDGRREKIMKLRNLVFCAAMFPLGTVLASQDQVKELYDYLDNTFQEIHNSLSNYTIIPGTQVPIPGTQDPMKKFVFEKEKIQKQWADQLNCYQQEISDINKKRDQIQENGKHIQAGLEDLEQRLYLLTDKQKVEAIKKGLLDGKFPDDVKSTFQECSHVKQELFPAIQKTYSDEEYVDDFVQAYHLFVIDQMNKIQIQLEHLVQLSEMAAKKFSDANQLLCDKFGQLHETTRAAIKHKLEEYTRSSTTQ